MVFATFSYENSEKVGVLSSGRDKIFPLDDLLNTNDIDMLGLIESFNKDIERKIKDGIEKTAGIDIGDVKILSPIPNPLRSVICLGKNYKEHVKEVKSLSADIGDVPENPIYFEKMVDRSQGDGDSIPSHIDVTNFLDYEVELAVIIGKEGGDIPADKVEEYIFGYTILNDITARDIQKKHIQWFRGKSLDGSCPMGPWIVHKDEIEFPPKLNIELYVNEELRQKGNTGDLIFDIPYIISDFSKGITLKPGDIISTGTPAGVGMGFKPPKTLKPGDRINCHIEKIGYLNNYIE